MLNPADRKGNGRRRTIIALLLSALLVSFIVFRLAPGFRTVFFRTPVRDSEIYDLLTHNEQNIEIPEELEELWERHRAFIVAFERMHLDLQVRLDEGKRYFDKDYINQLAQEFELQLGAFPQERFRILTHFAMNGDTPIKRAMAIIAIRESYPKKVSIYFANSYSNSSSDLLRNLSHSILTDSYNPSSIRTKFRPGFLQDLIAFEVEAATITETAFEIKSAEEEANETQTQASSPVTPPKKETVTSRPTTVVRLPIAVDDWQEIQRNGKFSSWLGDGGPEHWQVLPAGRVSCADFSIDGTAAAIIHPDASSYVNLLQSIPGNWAGMRVRAEADVLAHEPKKVLLTIKWRVSKIIKTISIAHRGTGVWEKLAVEVLLPSNVDPESLQVQIAQRPGATRDALVYGVSVSVNKPVEEWLRNSLFNAWKEESPLFWGAYPPERIKHAYDSTDRGLQILPHENEFTTLAQKIKDDVIGRRFLATALIKAVEPDKVVLAVRYSVDGKTKMQSVNHEGGDRWQQLRVELVLPENTDPGSAELRIGIRPGAEHPVIVEYATLRTELQ